MCRKGSVPGSGRRGVCLRVTRRAYCKLDVELVSKMEYKQNVKLPQGSASASAGKSPPEPSGSGCPKYSGGDNTHFETIVDEKVTATVTKKGTCKQKQNQTQPKTYSRHKDEEWSLKTATVFVSGSDTDCSEMDTALSDGGSIASRVRRTKRGAQDELTLDSGDESCTRSPIVEPKPGGITPRFVAKRGRGRPPTTGHYVDLAKAKEALMKAKQAEIDLDIELEMSQALKAAIAVPAECLHKRVENSIELVMYVATKSKRLKGTFVSALKLAAAQIQEAMAALKDRTVSEETSMLQAENAQLRTQLDTLREEVAGLRTEVERGRTPTQSRTDRTIEELRSSIMLDIGFMMDAKLSNLEDRLLPDKSSRLPVRADSVPSTCQPDTATVAKPNQATKKGSAVVAATSKGSAGKGAKKAKLPPPPPPLPPPPLLSSSSQDNETWTEVVKRGKKKKATTTPVVNPATTSSVSAKAGTNSKRKQKKAKTAKLRAPRSAAVVITLQPEAVESGLSYDKVLAEAREKINLGEIGITGLKFRLAATGARVLEIPGKESGDKADQLASKLRKALPDSVRVARPTKCADLRISGLDDSVTKEDIAAAIAHVGKCPQEQVKVGTVKSGLFGVGCVLVQCPVVAAKTLVDEGHILVGWSSARVQSLDPRPMQCYRCLEIGHTGLQCRSTVDRSRLCFRCCKPGHKAAECTDRLHCPLCQEKGRPAEHAIGGRKCVRLKKGQRVAARIPAAPAAQQVKPPSEAMVTGH